MQEKPEVNDKVRKTDDTRNKELATEEINERDKERVDDVGNDVGFALHGW